VGQFRGDETRLETTELMVQAIASGGEVQGVGADVEIFPPFAEAFSCKAGSPMTRTGLGALRGLVERLDSLRSGSWADSW